MDGIIVAVTLIAIGTMLGAWAWRGRQGMAPGPRRLLDLSVILLGIAALCVGAALMLELPQARVAFVLALAMTLVLALAGSIRKRQGAQTVQATAAAPEADRLPRVPLSTFVSAAEDAARSPRAQSAMRKAAGT